MKKVVVYNVFDSEAPDIRTVIHDKKRLILINCNQLLLLAKNGSHIISACLQIDVHEEVVQICMHPGGTRFLCDTANRKFFVKTDANWREIGDEADALSEVEQFYRQSHAILFDARSQSALNSQP